MLVILRLSMLVCSRYKDKETSDKCYKKPVTDHLLQEHAAGERK